MLHHARDRDTGGDTRGPHARRRLDQGIEQVEGLLQPRVLVPLTLPGVHTTDVPLRQPRAEVDLAADDDLPVEVDEDPRGTVGTHLDRGHHPRAARVAQQYRRSTAGRRHLPRLHDHAPSISAAVSRLIVAGLRPVIDPSCCRESAPELRSASMMAVWFTRASVLVVAVLRSRFGTAPPLAVTSNQVRAFSITPQTSGER